MSTFGEALQLYIRNNAGWHTTAEETEQDSPLGFMLWVCWQQQKQNNALCVREVASGE